MMYSTTQRSSFMRLERYYDEMIRAKRTPIFILVGNKADKNQQREVSTLEGKQKAVAWGCRFYETSAKTRHNVEEAFSNIVRELRVTNEQKAQGRRREDTDDDSDAQSLEQVCDPLRRPAAMIL